MDELKKVYGTGCLEYANRFIGLATRRTWDDNNIINNCVFGLKVYKDPSGNALAFRGLHLPTIIHHVPHDRQKRKIGLVLDKYDDGGLKVAILGDETLYFSGNNYGVFSQDMEVRPYATYSTVLSQYFKNPFDTNPIISNAYVIDNTTQMSIHSNNHTLNQLEASDWQPTYNGRGQDPGAFNNCATYRGGSASDYNRFEITTAKNNTLIFGDNPITDRTVYVTTQYINNPLNCLGGNLLSAGNSLSQIYNSACPSVFNDLTTFENYMFLGPTYVDTFNGVCIPFNLILTENEAQAINYVNNGVLPADAFLYPLDWDNLPTYNPDTPDGSDDDDNGGNPNNDADPGRSVDPTPLVVPSIVPSMFNANNVYWLGIGEFMNFLTWFWYDIQQFSILDPTTWDNLMDNVAGLYANLASAIISVRYMPVDEDWIGGLGTQSPIKLAQVQKDGNVNTISTLNQPPIEKIGSIDITNDFNSFLDLPPYSALTLYLPYYGYIDLDIDIFTGHSLDVYAVYDVLSGTIQYFLYYDDTFMVNTYLAKMAVDVPITLQSAYDRDRTIQQNVATALSGFMSAGAGAMSGNPIGMAVGVSSLQASMSPQNTAPIKVEGIGGEQAQLYAPSKCAIILRRPTTTKKGDAFSKNLGYLWCKTSKLSAITGLTVCSNPRIHFNGNTYVEEDGTVTNKKILPLDSEIEEIYNVLKEGAIL